MRVSHKESYSNLVIHMQCRCGCKSCNQYIPVCHAIILLALVYENLSTNGICNSSDDDTCDRNLSKQSHRNTTLMAAFIIK